MTISRGPYIYAITRLTAHFMCGLMSQVSGFRFEAFHLVWSGDLKFRKGMVIQDTECPYWDQVSSNNTNQTKFVWSSNKFRLVCVVWTLNAFDTTTCIVPRVSAVAVLRMRIVKLELSYEQKRRPKSYIRWWKPELNFLIKLVFSKYLRILRLILIYSQIIAYIVFTLYYVWLPPWSLESCSSPKKCQKWKCQELMPSSVKSWHGHWVNWN